ncbi:MAG: hypothetical protein ACRCUM_03830 [Mycoplasmoidaceae bacterium]
MSFGNIKTEKKETTIKNTIYKKRFKLTNKEELKEELNGIYNLWTSMSEIDNDFVKAYWLIIKKQITELSCIVSERCDVELKDEFKTYNEEPIDQEEKGEFE